MNQNSTGLCRTGRISISMASFNCGGCIMSHSRCIVTVYLFITGNVSGIQN